MIIGGWLLWLVEDVLQVITGESILPQIGWKHSSTFVTNVSLRVIWTFEQAIIQAVGHSMSDESITFHLAQSDTSTLLSTLDGLLSEDIDNSLTSSLTLVRHHMPESLVVHHTHIDVYMEGGTIYAWVECFIPIIIVPILEQLLPKIIHSIIILEGLEGSGFKDLPPQWPSFTSHTLDEHTDGHPAGKGVRVDDDVGNKSLLWEWHILLGP